MATKKAEEFGREVWRCGHSACSQNFIDTGSPECVHLAELVAAGRNLWAVMSETGAGADDPRGSELPKAQARLLMALSPFESIEV